MAEIKEVIEERTCLNIGDELIEKGKKMADAYISLYVLENYIRQYIDRKLTMSLGSNYMGSITISQKMKKGIEMRKSQEQEKKWLPLRGENDLYYLDFIELADFIVANWDCFKDDIKDQIKSLKQTVKTSCKSKDGCKYTFKEGSKKVTVVVKQKYDKDAREDFEDVYDSFKDYKEVFDEACDD